MGQVAPQPGAEADAATLSVAYAGPRGEAALDSRINILFSKAMRVLEGAASPVPTIALAPPVPGAFQWVGARALAFVPDAGRLPAATAFTLSIPAGTRALDGTTSAALDIPGSQSDSAPDATGFQVSWYRRELRDDRVPFFVDQMPAGLYHYRYLARATTLGRFVVPQTRAEEMYQPEVFGRTAAGVVEVR